MGKKKKKRLVKKKFVVRTVFGSSVVSSNSSVYVKVGAKYAKKAARELRTGEEVLFRKDGIPGLELSNVEEVLLGSARYAATAPVLFREIGDVRVPTFRYALLDGMLARRDSWTGVLDGERELPELLHLEPGQRLRAADIVRVHLSGADLSVSQKHIAYQWLTGRVISPRNRIKVVEALKEIAPQLDILLDEAFGGAYRLYTTIRSTVMRVVSSMLRGEGSASNGGERVEEGEQISVRPEIQLVVDEFATAVTQTHVAGRIYGVEEVEGEPTSSDESGILFQGIETGMIKNSKIEIKNLGRILMEMRVLMQIAYRIAFEYTAQNGLDIYYVRLYNYILENLGCKTEQEVEEENSRRLSKAAKHNTRPGNIPIHDEVIASAARRFIDDLYTGRLDGVYGFDVGLLSRLFEYLANLRKATPGVYDYMIFLQGLLRQRLKPNERIIVKREYDKVIASIDRLAGIEYRDGRNFAIEAMTLGDPEVEKPEDVYEGRKTPMQMLIKRRLYRTIEFLFSDSYAQEILVETGFGDMYHLFPKAHQLVEPVSRSD